MLLYQAPLEGISGYIFRYALAEVFGGVDKYFSPFVSPYEKRIITDREIKQLCPDNNKGVYFVPQIITMDAAGFVELTSWMYDNWGYKEFNLNFGCPSGTVVSKGRGAGALADIEKLKYFLDSIFADNKFDVSIKTRLGVHSVDEFEDILDIYNQYPLKELIIHPRVRDELYKGVPHKEMYKYAEEHSQSNLVYNGNISCKADYDSICNECDSVTQAVMIGRGMVTNPAIFREIKGGNPMSADELSHFLGIIRERYSEDFSGDVPVLHKMKEIWAYMGEYVVDKTDIDPAVMKKIKKSKSLNEYKFYEKEIVSQYKYTE